MSKKPYYLTTAIAYTSGKPHIGNTYEIVLADAIVRYKRFQVEPGLLGSQGLVPAILVIDGLLQLCPGGGGAQVDDLELHGATAAKLVDLGIKGRVHPAAGGQAQLPAVGGKPDGVQ